MTLYHDLTSYDFWEDAKRPYTRNVGWISALEKFPTAIPSEEVLDRIWAASTVRVAISRGIHECDHCRKYGRKPVFERHGLELALGTSEIRVFSNQLTSFAAPDLLYHYVAVHHYRPPEMFIEALFEWPLPPADRYFERLEAAQIGWAGQLMPGGKSVEFDRPKSPYQAVM